MLSSYGIQLPYVLWSILFSIINGFLMIQSAQEESLTNRVIRSDAIKAVIIGTTFFLTNLFVVLALDLPFENTPFLIYIVTFLLSCIFGIYFVLKLAVNKKLDMGRYVLGGLGLTLIILASDYTAVVILFFPLLEVKPVLLLMTFILTLAISFYSLRFLLQITRETEKVDTNFWVIIGSFATGIALAGIPYLTAMSVLPVINEENPELHLSMLPYALEIVMVWLLSIVPDLFGEQRNQENISKVEVSEQHFQSLFNHNPDAVISFDLNGRLLTANLAAEQVTGYGREELLTMSIKDIVAPFHLTQTLKQFEMAKQGMSQQTEISIIKKDKTQRIVNIIGVPIESGDGINGVYTITKDITENKKQSNTIEYLFHYDDYTGLPNRRKFISEVEESVKEQVPFAIYSLDYSRLRTIRDVFGFQVGDQILKELSLRLTTVLPHESVVSRFGGDEIYCLVPTRNQDIQPALTELQAILGTPFFVEGHEIFMEMKAGISMYPENGEDPELLIKCADTARASISDNSFHNFAVYKNNNLDTSNIEKIIIENELKRAIEQDELTLYYQPKVNSAANELVGFEALVRWNHPVKGLVSPGLFIPAAEQTNLIVKLEDWVVREASRQLHYWQSTPLKKLPVSVNISQRSFANPAFLNNLQDAMAFHAISASLLEIEITESMTMFNEKETIKKLNQLKELGIRISLDDFGTGYSSLSYLEKLPIDIIKIDKSFIDDLTADQSAMVSTILSIALHNGLGVIAEGVERKEQVSMLHSLGCDNIQGYYFSRPLPPEEVEAKYIKKAV
ncbi:putative bifunctional diguanylate cyclase/phosphodiesterase [Rossellomorea vietnamensis]|uniref:putative bifunctional diguanylate cyclase/phosphodiesterase n=1 Tax=Rossellomorea vietnamensis TaxID=218284 RepID=UPI003CE9FD92